MDRIRKNDAARGKTDRPNRANKESMPQKEKPKDFGGYPFVVNIEEATRRNTAFRRALWTGSLLQLTLMSIPAGGEIGIENHPHTDQFLRIEQGRGRVVTGSRRDALGSEKFVGPGSAIFIPAGTWHNLINIGRGPLKLYSIYAPPNHPKGTLEQTKK